MPKARPLPPSILDNLPPAEQAKFRLRVKEMGFKDLHEIVSQVYDKRHSAKWEQGWWEDGKFKKARPEQLAPPGDWMVWVFLGGRGTGKTRLGSEWLDKNARLSPPGSQVLLAGRTPSDVNTYMLNGHGGLLTNHPDIDYTPTTRSLIWPNGVQGIIRSGANPEEFRGYSGEIAWLDEFCLDPETLIDTEHGQRRIASIVEGERVWTRDGLRAVVKSSATRRERIYRLTTDDGHTLDGTGDHPVYVEGKGWTPLQSLVHGDMLVTLCEIASDGTDSGGGGTKTTTRIEKENCYTAPNTSSTTENSPVTSMSTTKTTTKRTADSPISKLSQEETISENILLADSLRSLRPSASDSQNGNGPTLPCEQVSAIIVESPTRASECVSDSVPPPAPLPFAAPLESTMLSVNVSGAEKTSLPTSTIKRWLAPCRVASISDTGVVRLVHNLSVDGTHEFFAGGILVHNCAWDYPEDSWHNLLLSIRERDPRVLITTSARQVKIFSQIIKDPDTKLVVGKTRDNIANLAPKFIKNVVEKLEGTRLGRRELDAEMLDKVEGALWDVEMFDGSRLSLNEVPPLVRVVVGVDPQGVKKEGAETGIVVAGRDAKGEIYILADYSINGTPFEWGSEVVKAYKDEMHKGRFPADLIVAEKNYGGEMVLQNIRAIDRNANVEMVNATRGKVQRAEPIAALYDRKMVHHCGDRDAFIELENEMCAFIPGEKKERRVDEEGVTLPVSPNRVDALTWTCTKLAEADAYVCTSATWGRRRHRGRM